MFPNAPQTLAFPFTLLVVVVATALVMVVQRIKPGWRLGVRLALGAWLLATSAAAASGWLRSDMLPPPLFAFVIPSVTIGIWMGYSVVGPHLGSAVPVWGMLLLQGFRFPLELLMHYAYELGLMPVQMSYSGRNFDIVTGIIAIVLGFLALRGSAPRWAIWAWNLLGTALLINIVTVAILSFPTPFRVFMNDPPNVWVTYVPFVWLPTLLVPAAAFGHAAFFRHLWSIPRTAGR